MPRKVLKGIVSSIVGDKTIKVKVNRSFVFPKLRKIVKRSKFYLVHCEDAANLSINDDIAIIESPPLSKRKRWCVNLK